MFSRRTTFTAAINELTMERERLLAAGEKLLDLTQSNPTTAGLEYPVADLERVLASASRTAYRPDPQGLPSAREALAGYLSRLPFPQSDDLPGIGPRRFVDPDDLILTASTSEAYSWLLKLLTDPGDEILTPVPSYPLLDHLASLENATLVHAPLDWFGGVPFPRWGLDLAAVQERLNSRSRAIVLIHPNNPTGSYVRPDEQSGVAALASARGMALISDEVFYDFPLGQSPRAEPAAFRDDVLTFSLGGLSKSAGLPHWKLGWIQIGGPPQLKREALEGLELIADTFLSVSSFVQEALPEVLALAPRMQGQIIARLRRNYDALEKAFSKASSLQLLPVEAGWSAVVRIPNLQSDEQFCLGLLRECHVIVQPGYFFDFPGEGYLVISLLTASSCLDEGIARMLEYIEDHS